MGFVVCWAEPPTDGLTAISQSRSAPNPLEGWESAQTKPALKEFTQRIQPILMNGCGTGSCHGGGQPRGGFQIHRPPSLAAQSPQLTRQNLGQAVSLLNRKDPSQSPLLKKALEAHGGATHPPLGGQDSAAYRALEEWALQVAPKPALATPASLASSPSAAPRAGGQGFADERSPEAAPAEAKTEEPPPAEPTKAELLKQLLERRTPGAAKAPATNATLTPPTPTKEELEKLQSQGGEGLLQTGAPPMLAGGQVVSRPAEPSRPAPQPAGKADAKAAEQRESGDPYDPATFNERAKKKR